MTPDGAKEKPGWDVFARMLKGQVALRQGEPRFQRSETLFNRDLSWLEFNDRVLSEAADPSVPPLERLRFVTIVSSNLDEFFMIRVAELDRTARRRPWVRSPDGLTAVQALAQVREHVVRQKARQATIFQEVLGALREHGIRIDTEFDEASRLDSTILENLPEFRKVLTPVK